MACRYIDEHSSELWESVALRTSGEVRPDLQSHLAGCEECRHALADRRAVWNALDVWEAPPVSPNFDTRLWREIEAQPPLTLGARLRQGFAWNSRPLMPLAAACLTVVLAVGVSMSWRSGSGSPARPEKVDMEQVEKTLDDMDLLRTLTPVTAATTPVREKAL